MIHSTQRTPNVRERSDLKGQILPQQNVCSGKDRQTIAFRRAICLIRKALHPKRTNGIDKAKTRNFAIYRRPRIQSKRGRIAVPGYGNSEREGLIWGAADRSIFPIGGLSTQVSGRLKVCRQIMKATKKIAAAGTNTKYIACLK